MYLPIGGNLFKRNFFAISSLSAFTIFLHFVHQILCKRNPFIGNSVLKTIYLFTDILVNIQLCYLITGIVMKFQH